MKESKKPEALADKIMNQKENFKGYTLEEIKYRRALLAMKAEFSKTKAIKAYYNLTKYNPLSPSSSASSLTGKAGAVAMKLINGLNYLDYAVIGFSVFSSLKKIASIFKKKKK